MPRSRYVGALFRRGIRHRSCSRHEIKAIDRRCIECTMLQDTRADRWIDDLSANLMQIDSISRAELSRSVLRNMRFRSSLSQVPVFFFFKIFFKNLSPTIWRNICEIVFLF